MIQLDEFQWLDGLAQAELVKKGEVTTGELLEAAIGRNEQLNPALNAVITPMYDEARNATVPAGPFHGVPFLLKDLGAAYSGVRLTGGSTALRDYVPTADSELVKRFKQAGLVTFGKTNTPEFGLLPTTEPTLLGACHNPWDLTRTAGGSSGGAAAAVAAGIIPVAHASDGGGSIRIPASCCGLFGLKPTRARTPIGPTMGDVISGLSIHHCVSRSVRDSAALLDAIAGPMLGDPYCAPPQERLYLEEVGLPPRPLKIAFSTVAPNGVPIAPDCVAAVEDAAKLCADLGHHVEEAAPRVNAERFQQTFTAMWAAGCSWSIKGLEFLLEKPADPAEYEPLTWAFHVMGQQISSGDYLLAVQSVQIMARQIAHFFTEYDMWLTPTVAEPPPRLGEFSAPDNVLHGFQRAMRFVPFTPIANGTGQPAMSVPLYWNEDNLPIGVHFFGRFGDEPTLFRLAAQLETARPWSHKRPPLAPLSG